jgi:hypothetical protein
MSNAEAVIWFNAWLSDMAEVSRYAKEDSIALVSGTTAYDIPEDCRQIHAVFHAHNGTYTKLDQLNLDDKVNTGWKIIDGHIVVQTLSFSASDTLLLVYFNRFPTIAVGDVGDKPEFLPPEAHLSGTFYAANRHQFREKWQDEANWLYALYLEEKGKYESQQQNQASTGRISARNWR